MTASTLSRPLLLAGSAVAASMGRAGLWSFHRYMRAPLASTGLLALVTMTALAGSNALYFQTARHPAPFFAPSPAVPVAVLDAEPEIAPQPQPMPEMRQTAVLPTVAAPETTGSVPVVAPVIPDAPVGNKDAFAVQKKLTEIGLFRGSVDGFYGPQTATAIRAFETQNGMTPTGALTPGVIDAILKSDTAGRVPVAQQPVPPAPVQQAVVQQPVAPAPQADVVIARVAEVSPIDSAVDTVGTAAANTLDSIVAAVDGGRSAPAPVQSAPVPQASLPAATAAPIQVASLEPMAAPRPVTAVQSEPVAQTVLPANNVQLVSQIQKGLASLGFYRGSIDGHPGDATARAIREFENFHSYKVTGQINPDLVGLLRQAGASI